MKFLKKIGFGGLAPDAFNDLAGRVEWQESRGLQSAVSPVGAQGVMQTMPGTMKDPGFGVKPYDFNAPDPEMENRRLGRDYLGAMLNRYKGDQEAALVAYNWGPGNADKWVAAGKDKSKLPGETRGYLDNILDPNAKKSPGAIEGKEIDPAMAIEVAGMGGMGLGANATGSMEFTAAPPRPERRPDMDLAGAPPAPDRRPEMATLADPAPENILGGEDPALGALGAPQAKFVKKQPPRELGLEVEQPKAPTRSQGLRALAHGATFGTSDEIEAGLRSTVDRATGKGNTYDERLDRARGDLKQYREDFPMESMVTEGVGALSTIPITGGAGAAANVGARIAHGARVGAGAGAAYGFGSGENSLYERGVNALKVGAVGAGVGGAVPAATGVIKNSLAPFYRVARGALFPRREAEKQVAAATVAGRAPRRGDSGITMEQERIAGHSNAPVMNIDRGGESTRALGRAAANASPEARSTLTDVTQARSDSSAQRVYDVLNRNSALGDDVVAGREALEEASRRSLRPAYTRAFTSGNRPINPAAGDDNMVEIMGSPTFQTAMRDAARRHGDRQARDGVGSWDLGVDFDDTTGALRFRRGADGQEIMPTLRYWDGVKRSLDNMARDVDPKNREAASTAAGFANTLRNNLAREVPEYGETLSTATRFFGAKDALDAGQKFISGKFNVTQAARQIEDMSDAERNLFREGFTTSLLEKVEKVKDRAGVTNAIFGSGNARRRIRVALGERRANELEAVLSVESYMDRAKAAIGGNSTTARQLLEAGMLGGGYGLYQGGDPMQAGTWAGVAAAGRYGYGRASQHVGSNVATEIADMLTSNDPNVMARGVRQLARNAQWMENLRMFMPGGQIASRGAAIYGDNE